MAIYFHTEEIHFEPAQPQRIKAWIRKIISHAQKEVGELNIIFTSNSFLLKMNQQYLKHNYFTDVITFNYNRGEVVSGDIFISIDQVKVNSKEISVNFADELYRVIIHGVLHLLGYDDKDKAQQMEMREKEDEMLALFKSM